MGCPWGRPLPHGQAHHGLRLVPLALSGGRAAVNPTREKLAVGQSPAAGRHRSQLFRLSSRVDGPTVRRRPRILVRPLTPPAETPFAYPQREWTTPCLVPWGVPLPLP